MSNFKDFYLSKKNQIPSGETALSIKNEANLLELYPSNIFIDINDIKQIAKEADKVARDEDFLSDFSDEIGNPMPNETEDDFVNRAKEKMRTLLKKRLADNNIKIKKTSNPIYSEKKHKEPTF